MRTNDFEVSKNRSYPVVKANQLIRNAKYDLSTPELKALAFVLSKVKMSDKSFQDIEFSIQEYCQTLGIDEQSGKNYNDIKETMRSIRNKSYWLKDGNSQVLFAWFSTVRITPKTGKITVRLDDTLKQYLLDLDGSFTKFMLLNELPMKSKYSIRIYELLKSYSFQKRYEVDIDELKKYLSCENYKNFTNFRVNVLDIATEEINKYTDISIFWAVENKGRKVVKIHFMITPKDSNDIIDAELKAEIELNK